MSKIYLGINQQHQPQTDEFSPNQYYYAKNVVINKGVIQNEKGNEFHFDFAINQHLIGTLSVNNQIIIFTGYSPNVNGKFQRSEIGVYDTDTRIYTKINNTIIDNLGFNLNNPIKSVYMFNFKQQIIIAFTDNLNPPRILNINYFNDLKLIKVNNDNDTLLFPKSKLSEINAKTQLGGNLLAGLHFVAYCYVAEDLTQTAYHNLSNPVWTTNETNYIFEDFQGVAAETTTNQQIYVEFKEVDLNYKYIKLALISIVKGVLTIKEIKQIPTIDFTYTTITGSEKGTTLNPEEIFVNRAYYDKMKCITLLQNKLYGANLETEQELEYQSFANNIEINYTTKLQNSLSVEESHKLSKKRTFLHSEVYAFYIRFIKDNGTYTRWFHIPARPDTLSMGEYIAQEMNFYSEIAGSTFIDYKTEWGFGTNAPPSHKLTDTCIKDNTFVPNTQFDGKGKLGFFYNEEQYPITGNFPTGKVRHHKFPSIKYMKENHYNNEPKYGTQKLDVLGIEVKNVTIPQKTQGYQIGYAKRNFSNCSVVTTDILQYGAVKKTTSSRFVPTYNSSLETWNTGGNWSTKAIWGSGVHESLSSYTSVIRMHSPDLMHWKPALSNLVVVPELKFRKTNLNDWFEQYGKEGGLISVSGENAGSYQNTQDCAIASLVVDYTSNNTQVSFITNKKDFYKNVYEIKYLPANTTTGKNNNIYSEDCAYLRIKDGYPMVDIGELAARSRSRNHDWDTLNNWFGGTTSNRGIEETVLFSLRQIKTDMYYPFQNQEIVVMNEIGKTNTATFNDGDCYIGTNSWINTAPYDWQDTKGTPKPNAIEETKIVIWRNHLGVFNNNSGLKYEGNGEYEKWYPYTKPTFTLAKANDCTRGNAWYLYNSDYNNYNVYVPANIYHPDIEFVNKFPHTIIWSNPTLNESQVTGWKTWLANDYYEQVKNRGEINNLAVFGERLFIHHELALFLTRFSTTIEGQNTQGGSAIPFTLKSNDIFSINPIELLPESGNLGTTYSHGCIVTKLGYAFVSNFGQVYLINDKIEELSKNYMTNFFLKYLALKQSRVIKDKIKVPFTSNCVNKKWVITIPKTRFEADLAPLAGATYILEYYDDFGVLQTMQIRLDKPAGILVQRSHYQLYPLDIITLQRLDFRNYNGYIYMDCYNKVASVDKTDNPYDNKGITLIYDDTNENNRLIVTKNNTGNVVSYHGTYRGLISNETLLCAFLDNDIVLLDNNEFKKLKLKGIPNQNTQIMIGKKP